MYILREIEFDSNPLKVCYSGQLLNGIAKIFFSVDTQIKGNVDCVTFILNILAVNPVVISIYSYLPYLRWKRILQMAH